MSGAVQGPSGEHLFRATVSTAFCERDTGGGTGPSSWFRHCSSAHCHWLCPPGQLGVFSDSPGQNFLAMNAPGEAILNLPIPIDRVRKF